MLRRVAPIVAAVLALGALSACDPPQPACPGGTVENGWHKENLDGDMTCGGSGRMSAWVRSSASNNVSMVIDGQPHVFYAAAPLGGDGSLDLRHAWYTGTGWHYETIDGNGANHSSETARTDDSVGEGISVVIWDGKPAVFYDVVNSADLKLARWTGSAWTYQHLTGYFEYAGRDLTAVMYDGTPHVFYNDSTLGSDDLHHKWWNGSGWSDEVLDGQANLPNGAVARSGSMGRAIQALVMGGQIQLFYLDDYAATGNDLRHGWYTPGPGWRFEVLDGDGGGSHTSDSLYSPTVALYGGAPHVFYLDSDTTDLLHAWWTGSTWAHETLDGDVVGSGGRANGYVDGAIATAVTGTRLHVFYSLSDGPITAIDRWVRRADYIPGLGWNRAVIDDPAAPRFVSGVTPQATGGTAGSASAIAWNGQVHFFATRSYGSYTGGSTGVESDGDLRHLWQ